MLVGALAKLNEGYYLAEIAKCTKDEMIKNMILNIILNEMNNAKYVYNYAKVVGDAPIDKLAQAIIKLQSAEYIYKFAKDIENVPIKELAEAIIRTNNSEYIFSFAKWVSGAPIGKLADAIIASGNITYMELFIHIDNAPVEKINAAINRIMVGAMSEEEKLNYLFGLAQGNNTEVIKYSADIYRRMFIDNEIDDNVLERPKFRVLKQNISKLK